MYRNFRMLDNKSRSIAMAVVEMIIALVLFILAFAIGGLFIIPLLLMGVAMILFSISSIFTFIKCQNFGAKNAFRSNIKEVSEEYKSKFQVFNTFITIFTIAGFVVLVVGIIVLLAQLL